jgi:hypothetical protein
MTESRRSPERKDVEMLMGQLTRVASEMKSEHKKMKSMMKDLEVKTRSRPSSSRDQRNSVTSDRSHRNRSYAYVLISLYIYIYRNVVFVSLLYTPTPTTDHAERTRERYRRYVRQFKQESID